MSKTDEIEVVAIACSDLHLSAKAPIWRSAENDWFKAMKRSLLELKKLSEEYQAPIICSGDLFDKWNSPPELINFALKNLPHMFAIPGQHDLPLHRYEDMHRSAFGTLIEAGAITLVKPGIPIDISSGGKPVYVHGFPWGNNLKPVINAHEGVFNIAIIHEYIWINGRSYPNAPKENKLAYKTGKFINDKWMNWDVVIFGDNHKGFKANIGKTSVFNCGGFMRRKADEIDYKPQIGLIYDDGEVVPWELDISKDKYIETMKKEESVEIDMSSFIEELKSMGDTAFDFSEAVKAFMIKNKTMKQVKKIIIESMEG